MKELMKSIAKNLNQAQENRDKCDLQNPLEAVQWHRYDAIATYTNSLIDTIDMMIEIEESINKRVAGRRCDHDSNGCHFEGYCKYRIAPNYKFGNGLPQCGLVKKNDI